METTQLERRLTEFSPFAMRAAPRLSLDSMLGERAGEVRRLLSFSHLVNTRHDRNAELLEGPQYIRGGVNLANHCNAVGELAYDIACKLGLDEKAQLEVLSGGKLHDVGKSEETDHLLTPEYYTDDVRARKHDHAIRGADIISGQIGHLHGDLLEMMFRVVAIVRYHHYPELLVQEDFALALCTLVVHFADKMRANTEARPGRDAKSIWQAYAITQEDLQKPRYRVFGEWRVRIGVALGQLLPEVRERMAEEQA